MCFRRRVYWPLKSPPRAQQLPSERSQVPGPRRPHDAVYDEIEESRKQSINELRLLDKLNLDGEVAALAFALMTLPAMLLAEPGFRPQNRRTGYPAREK
jgi:hypothetical protein